ncbi:complement C3-like isoform X1 [Huso huso]|uniref:Complement C3-like isoform X1 n=1 Tax=Huso huso TaxID=61971 RepID=A0ABR0Y8B1_HUSHU
MSVATVCLALLALSFPALCNGSPLYVMTAPNVLRVESDENVVVEAHGAAGIIEVEILVQDFPAKRQNLYSSKPKIILRGENSYQATTSIKIPADTFQKESRTSQFVYLVAKSNLFILEKVIVVSFHSGYVFVQTDKPIYTPTDTILYRVFALTHHLDPTSNAISLEIMNPDGIIINKEQMKPVTGISSSSYKLPEVVSPGIWKVVAKYEHTPQENFTSEFEVKEYVLPSFEVKVEPMQKFFYIDDKELTVEITATYLYGKKVSGTAYVIFGVLVEDEKKSFSSSLQRIAIDDGRGLAVLKRDDILSSFPDIDKLLQMPIYVSVTVLTQSGSDMVEAERSGIQIVKSPYTILFTKTSKYYKPGMPFDVMVVVVNPDGSPASNIDVVADPGNVAGKTQNQGTVKLTLNTQGSAVHLPITVKTKMEGLPAHRQAQEQMIALPYITQYGSNNYLHIGVQTSVLVPGENLPINLNIRNDNPATTEQIQYFSYLIINKGKLLKAGRQIRQAGQTLITISLPIDKQMIPSFRFVAYYHVTNQGRQEVVADSVWVDVKDSCMGTLLITPVNDKDRRVYQPRKQFSFRLRGDPDAKVGLVAVDKGVFVLNNKNKLSQTKIWDIIEKNDIGCTAGSGASNMGVFTDAGLVFESSAGIGTKSRSEPHCPPSPKRRRRSVILIEHKTTLESKYADKHIKKCCRDGMKEIRMDYTCEKRSQYITSTKECVDAFLHCCTEIAKRRKEGQRDDLALARSDEDDEYMSDDEIVSRTEFPESWLWDVVKLPSGPKDRNGLVSLDLRHFLKDSITTWEILAISVSPQKDKQPPLGICVADPYEVTVMQDFFIDLKLPYSVVRNEQVEIKAVLYNYGSDDITVRIELLENELVCSAASQKRKYRQEVTVEASSSRAVPFIIIPLKRGEVEIEVKASVKGTLASDGVRKKLLVVPEGVKVKKAIRSVVLNPSIVVGGVQNEYVPPVDLRSIVPDSDAQTFINVQGEILGQTLESAISGDKLGHLITVPGGCGEQNMITMTPPVIATLYLDKTNQWEYAGVQRRAEAIRNIKQGYTQQLVYRQKDSSYAAWQNKPGSTWLTAYVVKVFSMAYSLTSVDENVLCEAVRWLILNKQQPDGTFREDAPVIHGEMVGGQRSSEPEASLTAFVLIALLESEKICKQLVPSLPRSIEKSAGYLEKRIKGLQTPYAVAMTTYALALSGRTDYDAVLLRFASADRSHWPVPASHLFTLEATAYALMASVKAKQYDRAGKAVKWLTEQRFYGGGYSSTQATIIVFQAIADYMVAVPLVQDVNLDVELSLSGRSKPVKWKISNDNIYMPRSEKARIDQAFNVTAKGVGQGTLTVMTFYNAIPEGKSTDCKNFELDVSITRPNNAKRPEGALDTLEIKICTTYLGTRDATMSILDITMLTGFRPDKDDLAKMTNGVDQYFQKFEMDTALSDKGSLILYFDKISHKFKDCISFRVHKEFEVGLIQPAAVTVYEYYALENRCMKFYHPDKESGLLSKICQEEVCRCAEENCSLQKKQDRKITVNQRLDIACEPGTEYVYKAKLVSTRRNSTYDYYTMVIEQIIKEGSDENPLHKKRDFISHSSCRRALDLQEGRYYLIMGKDQDLWKLGSGMSYILGGGTWIEWWPTNQECQEHNMLATCQDIQSFADEMVFGCPS